MPKKDITAHQRARRWHDGVTAINAATAVAEIPGILAVWGKKLDLDMEGYNSLTNTMPVDAAIFAGIAYANREALADVAEPAIHQAVLEENTLRLINNVSSPARFPELLFVYGELLDEVEIDLTDFNRLFEGEPTDEEESKDATGKWAVYEAVYDGIPYASVDDLIAAIEEAVLDELTNQAINQAINAVNSADNTVKMSAALYAYADVLEIDMDGFDLLTSENKDTVLETMVDGVEYEDAAAIKTAFNAAVGEALEDQAVAAVNTATDASEMAAALLAYTDVFDIDMGDGSDYAALTPEKQVLVLEAMIVGKDYTDAASVKSAFDTAVAAQGE